MILYFIAVRMQCVCQSIRSMFRVLGIYKFVCGGTFGTIKALRSNRQRVKSTTTPRIQYVLDMKDHEGPCLNIYRGSRPYAHCGTLKKPCYMKFLFVGLYCTVADYRRFTVQLQLKTLLPCILLLSAAVKVQLR